MDAGVVAKGLVVERFADARAAWLGGSVARGTATATSDLDITVLLVGAPAPYRESLEYGGWPVELFVHTEVSLKEFRAKDSARRRPTMMRLVGESIVLLDTDGSGRKLQVDCLEEIAAGPAPLSETDLLLRRYHVTGLLDDLLGASDNDEVAAIAAALWGDAAELLLLGNTRWTGIGKGLRRELQAYDEAQGTTYASSLLAGLRSAINGDPRPLAEVVEVVLATQGGRLFEGFRLAAT
ncbi:nucleotidyltransferase domain-containing protein [Kribbella sp. NBC_01245]|uniref:nucleotidyltransferase domain-containing protein n=1 Tax=Kribbella sp. NBC_01245 TaxID=2903578 RepID=UPI002E2C35E2|nr:nucleotidyltransferase domain-containing protein [Kribbella sp. NBC_01245]